MASIASTLELNNSGYSLGENTLIIKSYAESLEKKVAKNIYPLGVLIEIELSNMKALVLFWILRISYLGIFNIVSPKKRLLELKFEWKNIRLFVTYSLPYNYIFSDKAQPKELCTNSFYSVYNLDLMNIIYSS